MYRRTNLLRRGLCCVVFEATRHIIKLYDHRRCKNKKPNGAQVTTLKKVTKIVLLNVLVLVNIVSNVSFLICEVQLFLFLPKTLSCLNTSFISLKFLQRDWISFATNLFKYLRPQKILDCKPSSCLRSCSLFLCVSQNFRFYIIFSRYNVQT